MGVEAVREISEELKMMGVRLFFANLRGAVRIQYENAGLFEYIDEDQVRRRRFSIISSLPPVSRPTGPALPGPGLDRPSAFRAKAPACLLPAVRQVLELAKNFSRQQEEEALLYPLLITVPPYNNLLFQFYPSIDDALSVAQDIIQLAKKSEQLSIS